MVIIKELLKPDSMEEALNILKEDKKARVIGGGAFLRLGNKLNLEKGIDLYSLGLDYIKEETDVFNIGAMTTIRDIETNDDLNKYFNGVLSESVRNIVGVQFRNIATIGGTVAARYGFSDLITALSVLDTTLKFVGNGEMSLEAYLEQKGGDKDILENISIKKDDRKASFQMMRNSKSDYAILNAAASKKDGQYIIAVGARPKSAGIAYKAMEYINNSGFINEEVIIKAAELAMEELSFGSNKLGSAEYRSEMCKILVQRALMEVELNGN